MPILLPQIKYIVTIGIFIGWTTGVYFYAEHRQATEDNVKALKIISSQDKMVINNQNKIIQGMQIVQAIKDDKVSKYESQINILNTNISKGKKQNESLKFDLNKSNRTNDLLLQYVRNNTDAVSGVSTPFKRANASRTYYPTDQVADLWSDQLNTCQLNSIQLNTLIDDIGDQVTAFNKTVKQINSNTK